MSAATDSKDCAAVVEEEASMAPASVPSKWTLHRRYVLALMSFFGLFHAANLRVNLSCAIVAMTTNHSSPSHTIRPPHVSQPLVTLLFTLHSRLAPWKDQKCAIS